MSKNSAQGNVQIGRDVDTMRAKQLNYYVHVYKAESAGEMSEVQAMQMECSYKVQLTKLEVRHDVEKEQWERERRALEDRIAQLLSGKEPSGEAPMVTLDAVADESKPFSLSAKCYNSNKGTLIQQLQVYEKQVQDLQAKHDKCQADLHNALADVRERGVQLNKSNEKVKALQEERTTQKRRIEELELQLEQHGNKAQKV